MKIIYLIVLLILSIFTNDTFSQSTAEYNCLLSIATKSGELSKVTINSSTSKYEFCKMYQCDSTGQTVVGGQFKSYVDTAFLQTDFSCLYNIKSITLYSFTFSSNFLTAPGLPITLTKINMYYVKGARINAPLYSWLTDLTFYPNETYTANINLSYLKTLEYYYQLDYTPQKTLQLRYVNDLTAPVVIPTGNSFGFEATELPSLSFITLPRIVAYSCKLNFNVASYSNFATYNNVPTIYIADLTRHVPPIPFPPSLVGLTSNVFIEMTFWKSFSAPTSLISMSNWKQLKIFEVHYALREFHLNGEIPFDLTTIQPSLEEFHFEDSTLYGLPNFNSFNNVKLLALRNNSLTGPLGVWDSSSKIKELGLSYNQLSGTVDESFCKLSLFDIAINDFTGTLPSCFTCYFVNLATYSPSYDDFYKLTSGFSGNSFTGVSLYQDQPNCTSIIPNLRYDSLSGKTYLYGKDLGFTTEFFESSKLYFQLDVPSVSFFAITTTAPTLGYYIDFTFKFSSTVYRVSSNPLPPTTTGINVVNNVVTIDGTYFSYNTSIVKVDIGGYDCFVTSSTFYQIKCVLNIPSTIGSSILAGSITVDTIKTELPIPVKNNTVVDTSKCQSLNYCNFNGECSTVGNTCTCDSKHTGSDCSGILCTDTVCNSNEYCNTSNGTCACLKGYTGSGCSVADHYATSVYQKGDENILIFGWFGKKNDNLDITIGPLISIGIKCAIVTINETLINCTLSSKPTNTGFQNVYIAQNSIEWVGKQIFKYQEAVIKISCFNDCSNNGICNSLIGSCSCTDGFTGLDCSSKKQIDTDVTLIGENEITETKIDTSNAVSTLSNSETIFEINVIKLIEFSFNGVVVKEWNLISEWSLIETPTSNGNKIYKFSQTLNQTDCTIVYTIEQIGTTKKNISFIGYEYTIDKGSLKMSIEILNYPYSSTLNNLQVQMKSKVGTATPTDDGQSGNSNNCNEQSTEIKQSINDNLLNYVSIKKNGKQMYGRFLSFMESDNRFQLMSTSIVSTELDSITLGFNLPFCNRCLLDPDFSVLLASDFKSSCENDDDQDITKRPAYVIPVAVVASVAGVSVIGASIFLIIKKKSQIKFLNKLKRISTTN